MTKLAPHFSHYEYAQAMLEVRHNPETKTWIFPVIALPRWAREDIEPDSVLQFSSKLEAHEWVMGQLNANQAIKIKSSGRVVYLDTCDHDPTIVSAEERPDELTVRRIYSWYCPKCDKTVAPEVFVEHPTGHVARW